MCEARWDASPVTCAVGVGVALRQGVPAAQVQDLETTQTGMGIDRALCYGPDDFRMGSFVSVYGRSLYLHDCDEFTRTWYKVRCPARARACGLMF